MTIFSPRIAALLASTLLCLPAAAQTIYKSTLPDGRVIYSQEPAKGAAKVETIATPPPQETGATLALPEQQEALKQREAKRALAREKAETELHDAEEALRVAEAKRAEAEEPQGGDVKGTASGGAGSTQFRRLSPDYFDRQKALDEAVEQARRRVDAARAAYREAWGD